MLTACLGSARLGRRVWASPKVKSCFIGWQIPDFQTVKGCVVGGIQVAGALLSIVDVIWLWQRPPVAAVNEEDWL